MLLNRHIDRICILIMGLAVLLTVLFINGERLGLKQASTSPGYEDRLFDEERVHEIDIVIDDWDAFLESAPDEVYSPCDVVIDGERLSNVGIRAKGNNSRRLVEEYGLSRYSLKLEFDHYMAQSYHGLDKLSLDSSFQDNSYLKTWIAMDMMRYMGVPTPLKSYAFVRVNGEDWGLFLALEEPEEAFLRRNFGRDHGQLYKPDYRYLNEENADVHLRYVDEDPSSYDNIFRNARTDPKIADKERLIEAIRILNTGKELETAVDVDEVLRYFTVQVFVVNLDSYLGRTGHNYFLYEEDGRLSMLPWDYNLAFSTYSLGMPGPVNDAELYVNYPIDTPASGEVMLKRPMYHELMKNDTYFETYHRYMDRLISGYFESGYFEDMLDKVSSMIRGYVKRDPTAFCSYEDHLKAVDTIRDFCLLRAESVRGQLNGEIGSTIAEQSKDRSSFVDASAVWLPDMGELSDLSD